MKVLVIRHSSAIDPYSAPSDELRWLTPEGRARMRRVASKIAQSVTPTHIYTSPLVRAVQTAEILAAALNYEGRLIVHPPLAVDYGTTAQALSVLDAHTADDVIALVSHAPKVRVLAGHLSGQGQMPGFTTGSTCCVQIEGDARSIAWWLDPDTL